MELYRWYILKYGAYALLAVALFRLQSIPGLLEIGGGGPPPGGALALFVGPPGGGAVSFSHLPAPRPH